MYCITMLYDRVTTKQVLPILSELKILAPQNTFHVHIVDVKVIFGGIIQQHDQ